MEAHFGLLRNSQIIMYFRQILLPTFSNGGGTNDPGCQFHDFKNLQLRAEYVVNC
jgi:hypothetical protein